MRSEQQTIFVTVGTTLFDALIQSVSTEPALQWMIRNGYSRLVVQYGKGSKPQPILVPGLEVECYDFKPSLEEDMKAANLIICHAGAGTVMETLRLKKRVVVVINTKLMDNHQTEIAGAMGKRNHLFVVETPKLMNDLKVWDAFETFQPLPKEDGDAHHFPQILERFLGWTKGS
jgi:beta-1,4-N-acetylglucosaminyltransferase